MTGFAMGSLQERLLADRFGHGALQTLTCLFFESPCVHFFPERFFCCGPTTGPTGFKADAKRFCFLLPAFADHA